MKATVALADLSAREMIVVSAMAVSLIWLGLYPQTVLTTAKQSLDALQKPATVQEYKALTVGEGDLQGM
jgi:NADH:ubiquinone oxidoreductase subunit 4 (subunit M)